MRRVRITVMLLLGIALVGGAVTLAVGQEVAPPVKASPSSVASGGLQSVDHLSEQPEASPICGDDVKHEVIKSLANFKVVDSNEALGVQKELYEKFKFCAAQGELLSAADIAALTPRYCGRVGYVGSLWYEQMRCCGYDPQKQLFGCPVEIKQPAGFGPAPFPGSREHVLTCVDFGNGLEPVARDDVHLANLLAGNPDSTAPETPYWNFAVIAPVRNKKFANLPLDGRTLRARSILSWNLVPTSCTYQPIWGNWLDYKIRLDP